jgi:GNAT superfamily N-acetyltransferase
MCSIAPVAHVISQATLKKLDGFWSREIGCSADVFLGRQDLVIALPSKDGSEFARLFRRNACRVLTCSPNLLPILERARGQRGPGVDDASFLSSVFGDSIAALFSRVFLGYADERLPERPQSSARLMGVEDRSALEEFRARVGAREWDDSGIDASQPIAGWFVGDELVAAAGYEVWGGWIAHVGVVTAPSHRGLGYGRDVVARVANHAIARGLVAQYQTLGENAPSMRVAAALGFCPYAEFTYAVVRQSN